MSGNGKHSFTGNLPPQNLEAERALIGAWIIDDRSIDECADIVRPEDFYRDSHRIIASAILEMRNDGRQVDAVTLADELQRRGEYKGLGGDDALMLLCESAPHSANAKYHAQIVHRKATIRETIQACTEIIREGYSNCLTDEELLDLAERAIFAIAERDATGANINAGELADEGMLAIDRRTRGTRPGLLTGFPDLDDLLDGIKPSDLIVLAARPSQGKTAFALSVMGRACLEFGKSVLFASLEMNRFAIADRLFSALAGIDALRLQRPWTMTADERLCLSEAADRLREARLTIDDRPRRTLGQVAANARRLKARGGLDLVAIDYLSLLDGQRLPGENRQEEVARMSTRLKGMARELRIPVLCVHQLNRQNEQRGDMRPRLSDLRESGQIEQDADVVLLLHRPEFYDPNDQPGVAEVIVAKNRNGPTGTIRLRFARECTRFEPIATF